MLDAIAPPVALARSEKPSQEPGDGLRNPSFNMNLGFRSDEASCGHRSPLDGLRECGGPV
jgi:hypothetical protein